MKFLYTLLAVIWLAFGWTCIEAMRWEPPRPAPYHYARLLQQFPEDAIDRDIKERKLMLMADDLSLRDRSRERYQLSFSYLLKAFRQPNQTSQILFFDKALNQALEALRPFPDDWPKFWTRAAEIYALKGDWDKADEYYEKALRIAIEKYPNMVKEVVDSQKRVRGSRPPS